MTDHLNIYLDDLSFSEHRDSEHEGLGYRRLKTTDMLETGMILTGMVEIGEFVVRHSFSTLVLMWGMLGVTLYTLISNPYTLKSRIGRERVNPFLQHYKKKLFAIAFKTFLAGIRAVKSQKVEKTIEYHASHCVVTGNDGERKYKLLVPYNAKMKKLRRYKIVGKDKKGIKTHLETIPGVPILVSPSEMGFETIEYSRPGGDYLYRFESNQRDVCDFMERLSPGKKKND